MPPNESGDPAAIFAIATSLWQECHKHAASERCINLSDAYRGIDSLMREVMRIATLFESWACEHVDFDALTDVWPYMLEDRFGKACLSILLAENLSGFEEHDCRRVAARLRLTLRQASTGTPPTASPQTSPLSHP